MAHYQKLSPAEYKTTAWSGGKTTELAIAPEGAVYAGRDFLWRISSATVELAESSFTPLPDYSRYISLLQGEMRLTHGCSPEIQVLPLAVHAFDGGETTHSRGRCTDFNLMLHKGRCTGTLSAMEVQGEIVLHPADAAQGQIDRLFYCARGSLTAETAGGSFALTAGESLLVRDAGRESLRLVSPAGAALMTARMIRL